jgi:TonB-dependent SusC/RagA subfamily outer membrane receptor
VSRTTADLRGVNPRDVERIEVVKDAAASFYRARGADGVIVITTRRALSRLTSPRDEGATLRFRFACDACPVLARSIRN